MAQIQKNLWFLRVPISHQLVSGLQIILILCEIGLLLGWRPRMMAFVAFLARGYFSYLFPFNDYLYFTVVALLLSVSECEEARKGESLPNQVLAWPRDVLVLQTAWIYFAAALFKLGPNFISGGDLYVRQNYAAEVLPLPFPEFYRSFISTLSGNAILAWSGIFVEASIAMVLVAWWWFPEYRRKLRFAAIAIAIGIHGYAALFLNVFFFGASMLAQVVLLTYEPTRSIKKNRMKRDVLARDFGFGKGVIRCTHFHFF